MDFVARKQIALVAEASRWIGVRERGRNAGPEVEAFQRAVDGKANGEPWCLAFVQFCLAKVDAREPGPGSWLYPTEHCLACWNQTTPKARVIGADKVRAGDIVIWQLHADGKPTAQGHAGIVTRSVRLGVIETIEGNTTGGGAVNGEGDGVYRRLRELGAPGALRFKGVLRPWGVLAPATDRAA